MSGRKAAVEIGDEAQPMDRGRTGTFGLPSSTAAFRSKRAPIVTATRSTGQYTDEAAGRRHLRRSNGLRGDAKQARAAGLTVEVGYRGPNQVARASKSPSSVPCPTQAT